MGNAKPSNFIIALIWISFFAAIFGTWIANLTVSYHTPYDSSQVELFNKLDKLYNESQTYKNSSLSFKENTGIFDVIGGYFSNGYRTMKIALSSLDIFNDMTDTAMNNIHIPAVAYLKTAIILTVLIIFIIGIMLSAILKREV